MNAHEMTKHDVAAATYPTSATTSRERVPRKRITTSMLICLPELFRSRYFAQREDAALFDLAEPVPGPSTEALGAVARETGAEEVIVGVASHIEDSYLRSVA